MYLALQCRRSNGIFVRGEVYEVDQSVWDKVTGETGEGQRKFHLT